MSKALNLKASAAHQLYLKLDQLKGEALGKLKNGEENKALRWRNSICAEFEEGNKDLRELLGSIEKEVFGFRDSIIKEMSDVVSKSEAERTDEDKARLAEGDRKLAIFNSKLNKDHEAELKTASEKEVKIVINGNDRFDFLKLIWEKESVRFELPRKVWGEIDEAFEGAKEA